MGNRAALRPSGRCALDALTDRAIHGSYLRRKIGTDGHLGQAIDGTALPLPASDGTHLARIPRTGVDIYNGHHASPNSTQP